MAADGVGQLPHRHDRRGRLEQLWDLTLAHEDPDATLILTARRMDLAQTARHRVYMGAKWACTTCRASR